jgi:hypothetical protein
MAMRAKHKYGLNEVAWDDIKAEMRHILVNLACQKKTICYSDLASQIQTAYIHHRAPAFMGIF